MEKEKRTNSELYNTYINIEKYYVVKISDGMKKACKENREFCLKALYDLIKAIELGIVKPR